MNDPLYLTRNNFIPVQSRKSSLEGSGGGGGKLENSDVNFCWMLSVPPTFPRQEGGRHHLGSTATWSLQMSSLFVYCLRLLIYAKYSFMFMKHGYGHHHIRNRLFVFIIRPTARDGLPIARMADGLAIKISGQLGCPALNT
jgi:hypothetical protein